MSIVWAFARRVKTDRGARFIDDGIMVDRPVFEYHIPPPIDIAEGAPRHARNIVQVAPAVQSDQIGFGLNIPDVFEQVAHGLRFFVHFKDDQ